MAFLVLDGGVAWSRRRVRHRSGLRLEVPAVAAGQTEKECSEAEDYPVGESADGWGWFQLGRARAGAGYEGA